jgi:hypothetical protein
MEQANQSETVQQTEAVVQNDWISGKVNTLISEDYIKKEESQRDEVITEWIERKIRMLESSKWTRKGSKLKMKKN